jgi:diaminopimelate decarboxylase
VLQLDVSVDIARAAGAGYVYAGSIRATGRWLRAESAPHQIGYGKANSSLAVLRVLRDLSPGCDIVSVSELFLARTAG